MALFQLDDEQFEKIDASIGGLNGAVNKLAEAISPVDSSVHAAISEMSVNIAKWQGAQLQAIKDGFVLIADVLSNHQTDIGQAEIDAAVERLKTSTDQLQTSIEEASD